MEAARAFESSAMETRERLEAFVAGVTARLPHVRQGENALLYGRGLVEHGGRKSLQPTLDRLGSSPTRYYSSFWPTLPGRQASSCGSAPSGLLPRSASRPGSQGG